MDSIFKNGNYLRDKFTHCIFQVIAVNPTKEDWDEYFSSMPYGSDRIIVKYINSGRYDWWTKRSEDYELVNYMYTPLWKALEG